MDQLASQLNIHPPINIATIMGWFDSIKNGIGNFLSNPKKAIGDLWQKVRQPIGNVISTVSDAADKFGGKLVDMLPAKYKKYGEMALPFVQKGLHAGSSAFDNAIGHESHSYLGDASKALGF
jgi:hypothetical protein